MDKQLENAERKVDIIADQNKNEVLRQLLVQLHKGGTIRPATESQNNYTKKLPNRDNDTFGGFCDKKSYEEFLLSLTPAKRKEKYFYDKHSQLLKQYLHQKQQEQLIQFRGETHQECYQQYKVLQQQQEKEKRQIQEQQYIIDKQLAKALAAKKRTGKRTETKPNKVLWPWYNRSNSKFKQTSTQDRVIIQKIDDQFGDGWYKFMMDVFAVKMIADQFRDRLYKYKQHNNSLSQRREWWVNRSWRRNRQ